MIREEDYKEPVCPLCDPNARKTLPLSRILDKFDGYLYQKEYEAALSHLDYWEKEADEAFDTRAKLAILNEKIGLFRYMERADEALAADLYRERSYRLIARIKRTVGRVPRLTPLPTGYSCCSRRRRSTGSDSTVFS